MTTGPFVKTRLEIIMYVSSLFWYNSIYVQLILSYLSFLSSSKIRCVHPNQCCILVAKLLGIKRE